MGENNFTTNDIMEFMQAFAENVDKKFEQVDKRFEQVDKRFEQIDSHFEQSDTRLGRLETVTSEILSELRYIKNEIKDIKIRLDKLEKRTLEDADAAAHDIIQLRDRVETLENQVRQLQGAGV